MMDLDQELERKARLDQELETKTRERSESFEALHQEYEAQVRRIRRFFIIAELVWLAFLAAWAFGFIHVR